MKTIEQAQVDTCLGRFTVYADAGSVVAIAFEDEWEKTERFLNKQIGRHRTLPAGDQVERYAQQFPEFFSGKRRDFEIPYTLHTTPFRKKVLEAVASIPYGQVYSYKDIGQLIGSAGYRAIGGAVKNNPLPILIPCHRVVGSSGIGGYSMAEGLKTKQFLLLLEKNNGQLVGNPNR